MRFAILTDRKEIEFTLDVIKWARNMEANREVKQDHLNGFFVSTVFLGLNQNYWGSKPLWFETMVFDEESQHLLKLSDSMSMMVSEDRGQWRYETYMEALEGHERALALVREGHIERKTKR